MDRRCARCFRDVASRKVAPQQTRYTAAEGHGGGDRGGTNVWADLATRAADSGAIFADRYAVRASGFVGANLLLLLLPRDRRQNVS